MNMKNKERHRTISCGTIPWRLREGTIEVLLIKQFAHKDAWGIPKGHVHAGESTEECAMRETREEAGVGVKLGRRLTDVSVVYRNEEKTVISYLSRPVGNEKPKHDDPDSEVADAQWFSTTSLPKIHQYQQSLVYEAIGVIDHEVEHEKEKAKS
jgi:8-oxo-dGTP diphosphatase